MQGKVCLIYLFLNSHIFHLYDTRQCFQFCLIQRTAGITNDMNDIMQIHKGGD
ncbi:hypothetical protein BKN48_03405 [Bacillus subtilis]|nr:hypothetical protein BKN48_03405 [Bacillus subtilis]